jgi:hypothetical protein
MIEFLEKDLEDLIFNSERDELEKRGFPLIGKLKRQVKIGNYGICDLIEIRRPEYSKSAEIHKKGLIIIHELKKDSISVSAFLQAVRYTIGVKSYLDQRGSLYHFNLGISIIGTSYSSSSEIFYFPELFKFYTQDFSDERNIVFTQFILAELKLSGVNFKEIHHTGLVDEGFYSSKNENPLF